jgi:hypothetical protein
VKEKRSRNSDRRQESPVESELELPLFDDDGNFIIEDRRAIQDRRLNNISIEEVEYEDYINQIIKHDKE